MRRQGAVGGDVVGDELAEEGPTGRDIARIVTALDVDYRAAVTGATDPAERPELRLIRDQRGKLGEERP